MSKVGEWRNGCNGVGVFIVMRYLFWCGKIMFIGVDDGIVDGFWSVYNVNCGFKFLGYGVLLLLFFCLV